MRYALFIIVSCFTWMAVTTAEATKSPAKVDDVFLDESEGDFNDFPAVPSASVAAPTQHQPKKAQPEPQMKVETAVEALPRPEPVASQPAVSKPEPTKPVVSTLPKRRKPASLSKAKRKPSSSGLYLVTKEACPMLRQPASESPAMLTVKALRKLWVEEVDELWVRAFNKAGEPGYISRDCF